MAVSRKEKPKEVVNFLADFDNSASVGTLRVREEEIKVYIGSVQSYTHDETDGVEDGIIYKHTVAKRTFLLVEV